MSQRAHRAPEKALNRFLEVLAEGATIAEAAKASGIGRRTAYDLRERDEEFALRWADAIEDGTEVLERVARARAVEGSDNLLIFLLKARLPEVYRERTEVKHSGQVERLPSSQVAEMQRIAASDDEFRDF